MDTVLRFVGLDLELDSELQEIIDLTCALCKTPIALITFLDEDTQYLKVKKGTQKITNSRKDTFCTYAIKQDDVMVVPNAVYDDRFSTNPGVTGEANIRFYAGVPLISAEGQKVGTLCVLDTKENNLDEQQKRQLKIIARQVMKIVEFKWRTQALEHSLKEVEKHKEFVNDASIRLRSFFESSTNFQVLLGKNGDVIDFNKTAFSFVKNAHKTDMKRGDLFVSYVAPEFVSRFIDGYHLALSGQRHIEEGSTNYGELGVIWWDATFDPARGNNDEIIGVSYLIRNITERKEKEQKIVEQNESLLSIAHMQAHEFRAPLTTIMGLMGLIKENDYVMSPVYLRYLDQAVNHLDEKIKDIVTVINNVAD